MQSTEEVIPKKRILYIGKDQSLGYLIAAEAMRLELPFFQRVDWQRPMGGDVWIADLDDVDLLSSVPEYGPPILGISRREAELPTSLRERCDRLLHRPFLCRELRHWMEAQISVNTVGQQQRWQEDDEDHSLSVFGKTEIAYASPDIKLQGGMLLSGKTKIALTASEAALAECLLSHRGCVVSKEVLKACMTSRTESSESSNRLEVYICYLRKKLEQLTGIRLIRTVRGIGYRLD